MKVINRGVGKGRKEGLVKRFLTAIHRAGTGRSFFVGRSVADLETRQLASYITCRDEIANVVSFGRARQANADLIKLTLAEQIWPRSAYLYFVRLHPMSYGGCKSKPSVIPMRLMSKNQCLIILHLCDIFNHNLGRRLNS